MASQHAGPVVAGRVRARRRRAVAAEVVVEGVVLLDDDDEVLMHEPPSQYAGAAAGAETGPRVQRSGLDRFFAALEGSLEDVVRDELLQPADEMSGRATAKQKTMRKGSNGALDPSFARTRRG